MAFFYKTERYDEMIFETQLCQRAAPTECLTERDYPFVNGVRTLDDGTLQFEVVPPDANFYISHFIIFMLITKYVYGKFPVRLWDSRLPLPKGARFLAQSSESEKKVKFNETATLKLYDLSLEEQEMKKFSENTKYFPPNQKKNTGRNTKKNRAKKDRKKARKEKFKAHSKSGRSAPSALMTTYANIVGFFVTLSIVAAAIVNTYSCLTVLLPLVVPFKRGYSYLMNYCAYRKSLVAVRHSVMFGDPNHSREAYELILKIAIATDWTKKAKVVSSILAIAQVIRPGMALSNQITYLLEGMTNSTTYHKNATRFGEFLERYDRFQGQADEEKDEEEEATLQKWWDQISNSDMGIGVMQIAAMLVTAGIVPEVDLTYSNIELFSLKAATEAVKVGDIWKAGEKIFKSCVEGVAQYQVNGSFIGFFGCKSLESECSYALSLYQQVLIGNLGAYASLTNEDYIGMLEKLRTKVIARMRNPKSNDRFFFKTYLDRIDDTLSAMAAIETEQQAQETAFGILFHGHSSVGKSRFAIPMMKWLLMVNGYQHENANVITYNTNSEYDDQVRNNTYGILLDDLANGKVGKGGTKQRRTSDVVIALINNVAQTAVKADLAEKGKVLMKPKVVIATTNNQELNASVESHNEASVHRRFRFEVEFNVRDGYTFDNSIQLCGAKVVKDFPKQQFPDVWDFTIRECVIVDKKKGNGKGFEMRQVETPNGAKTFNMLEFMTFMKEQSKLHFELEREGLEDRKSNKPVEVNEDGLPVELFNAHSIVQSTLNFFSPSENYYDAPADDAEAAELVANNPELLEIADINNTWTSWMLFGNLPRWALRLWIYVGFNTKKFVGILMTAALIVPYGLALSPGWQTSVLSVFVLILEMWFIKDVTAMSAAHTIAVTSLTLRTRRMWALVMRRAVRTNYLKHIAWFSGTVCAGFILVRLCKSVFRGQSIEAKTVEDAEDKIHERSAWSFFRGLVGNTAGGITSTMTTNQLENRIANNVVYVQHEKGDNTYRGTNALFVSKGYLMVPYHFVKGCPNHCVFMIHRGNGRVEEAKIDFGEFKGQKQWTRIGSDLVLIRVTGVNFARDITDLFATRYGQESISNARQVYIKNGQRMFNKLMSLHPTEQDYSYNGESYKGLGYVGKSEVAPECGMCTSPIISDIRCPQIIGVHIAGREKARNTLVLSVTQQQICDARKTLDSTCAFQEVKQDEAYLAHAKKCSTPDVHEYCATQFASNELPLDVLGTVPGSGPRFMNTKKTPYHDVALNHLGIKNDYGVPKASARLIDGELKSPWRNCIEELNQAKNLIPYTFLERAREEIVAEITQNLDQYVEAGGIARPLTVDEAINGIPGIRGIDGQKMATSAGLKYGGIKKKHLEKEEWPYVYKPYVYEDVEKLRAKLASRTRSVNALNSNLKDEPLKKKKVDEYRTRVFFSDELDSLIVCGQLFGPILAYMMNHPESSHCAIGLNAQSFDWECVAKYLTRDDTVPPSQGICLDFKAFDKTLPENLMKMAWTVMIDIARKMPGYTEEDINIMITMADEKTTPFMYFNGTLIQLNFDHTSGNLCTAAVGSIAGLMLLCVGFYAIEDPDYKKEMKALDYVRSIHLGDDLASTVRDVDKLNYNFISLQRKLKEYGITITMPDKEAEPTPFQNVFKEDFLKRIFAYCPIRNAIVGQLDRKSLYKSLLYFLPSKVETRENQLGQSLSSVLGEISLYDRREFDEMKKFVMDLAFHYQLNVPNIEMEYDDYVIRWAVDSGKRHPEYQERSKPYIEGLAPKMSISQQKTIFGKQIYFSDRYESDSEEQFLAHAGDIEATAAGEDILIEITCCHMSSCCPWFRKKPLINSKLAIKRTSLGSGHQGKANIPSSVENNGDSERPTDQEKTPSEDKSVATATRC